MAEKVEWWGVLGANRRKESLGQTAPVPGSTAAHTFIQQVLEQDLPPAMEKAADAIEDRYKPWPTVIVASLIVTAIGVTILAVKALAD